MAVFNKALLSVLAFVMISYVMAHGSSDSDSGSPAGPGFYYESRSRASSSESEKSTSDVSFDEDSSSDSELDTSLSYGDVYGHGKPAQPADISISWSAEIPNYKPQKCPELDQCKKQFKSVTKMIDLLQDEKESTMRLIKTKLYKSKDLEDEVSKLKHKNHNLAHKINMQDNKIRSQNMSLDAQNDTLVELQVLIDAMKLVVYGQSERCERGLRGIELEEGPFGTYHFYSDEKELKSWHGARDWCRSHGMALASAETAAENIWLSSRIGQILADVSKTSLAPTSYYWFGLNNLANHHYLLHNTYDTKHHQWFWYTSGKESTYFNWAENEPSNAQYTSSEQNFDSESTSNEFFAQRCIAIGSVSEEQKWYDEDCYNQYRFVCEIDTPCPMKRKGPSEGYDMSYLPDSAAMDSSMGSY